MKQIKTEKINMIHVDSRPNILAHYILWIVLASDQQVNPLFHTQFMFVVGIDEGVF